MARLPVPGSDSGQWGNVLNNYLAQEHNSTGTLKIRTDGTLSGFYSKPGSGIPVADLSSTVQASLTTADARDAVKLRGTTVSATTPTDGQVLVFGSSQWGPGLAVTSHFATFTQAGVLAITTSALRYHFPVAAIILGVSATVGTAPTGASLIIDINKNGTTIFTTQSNRPTITAGSFASTETTPNVTAVTAGQYLTIDIDQIGSTIPGSDLTVQIRYQM